MTTNSYAFWEAQLGGKNPPWSNIEEIHAGYFRSRYHEPSGQNDGKRVVKWEAVAFWFADGSWNCQRTKFGDGSKMRYDEMVDLFAGCCRHAVTYETFEKFLDSGAWPEGVETVEGDPDAAPAEDANLPAHARAKNAIAKKIHDAKTYLKELGHKPETQEEADKIANFSQAINKIMIAAEKAREAEKAPHLKAGKEIDANWRLVKTDGESGKVWLNSTTVDFIKKKDAEVKAAAAAENAKRQAEYEADKAREAQERADAEHFAGFGIESAPVREAEAPLEVKAEKVKIGTGTRQQSLVKADDWVVDDFRKVVHFLAERNTHSEAFKAAALAEAKALAKDGLDVPGLTKIEGEKVR